MTNKPDNQTMPNEIWAFVDNNVLDGSLDNPEDVVGAWKTWSGFKDTEYIKKSQSIPKSKIEALIKERTYGFSGYQKGRRVEGGVILVSDLQALLTEDE